MARSLFILSLIPALAAAVDPTITSVSVSNMETFPSIVNDLSTYATSVFLSQFPTGTLEPVYPSATGNETATATGSGIAAPYPTPSGNGTASEAPVSSTGGAVYPTGNATETVGTTVATSYGVPSGTGSSTATGSGSGAPVASSPALNNTASAVGVKLPIVLGAMAVGFALL